ncbi:MAG: PAS domain S-box protein [Deltaproteobacteria bacterium]|nr:PAS domain S-box protein [Deltaproteobacteria bacterium]
MAKKATYEELKQKVKELKKEALYRKRAEQALQESEEKYKELANSLPQIVFEMDKKGNLTFANHNAFELFGYRQNNFNTGLNALEMLIPQDRESALENMQRVLNGAVLSGVEYTALRKDGSTFPVTIHSNPIIRENKPVGLRGIMIDLSEQKRSEESLRESEFRFRSLFDLSPQAIALTELESGTLINVNAKFCEITKYSMEELIGRSTAEMGFYSKSDRGHFIKELQTNGEVRGLEMDFRAKDDLVVKALMFARPVNIAGKSCIITVFLDLTEQKFLESQLRQAHRMEAIGTLAGGIAHDFNNILFPIVGFTEIAMDDLPEDSTARKSLNQVIKNAMRAKDLVLQILTFSRQHDYELKPLKVQLVVKEALSLIRSSLPATIEIRQKIDKHCGTVMADPTQIHQIIMNLCTNAYHAMAETGGTLEVILSEVELTADGLTGLDMDPGAYLCLKMGDTGHGMDQAVVERIFEPYFTTKEKGKGTGLGLAVVHGIVKSYGGDIRVSSEPDKGAVFTIYLPLIKEVFDTSETVTDEKLPTGHEQILLVDDEKQIVFMEKQILEYLGYQVTARTCSIEALATFREQPLKYDLVITDMIMPNMTGDKLSVELMNIRPDIPVILCTGFSEKMPKERANAMGIHGFLMKPMALYDLAKTVRDVLDNQNKNQ